MRADRLRLLDAVEQIELISRFSHQGRDAFFSDVLIQSAVLHRLALLGEACRGVSSALREAHPEVPRPQIIAFLNVRDLSVFWDRSRTRVGIVTGHVAVLGERLRSVVDSLPD